MLTILLVICKDDRGWDQFLSPIGNSCSNFLQFLLIQSQFLFQFQLILQSFNFRSNYT